MTTRRQLHDHTKRYRFRSTPSRSCRRASTPTSRSWSTAAPTVYEDRYAPFAYTGNPDFNYRSFRTTNVLRWEYKPGLDAVCRLAAGTGRQRWTHGTFDFTRDFGGVFSSAAKNVFLIKWAYWLNY